MAGRCGTGGPVVELLHPAIAAALTPCVTRGPRSATNASRPDPPVRRRTLSGPEDLWLAAGRSRKPFRRNPLGDPDECPVLPQLSPDPMDLGVSEASTGTSLTACGAFELRFCRIHTCGFPRLSTGPSTGSVGSWGQVVHMLFIHSFHRLFRPQLLNRDVSVRGLGTTCGFLEDSSRNPQVVHRSMHSVHNWPESGDRVGDALWTRCGQQNLSTTAVDSSSSYPLAIHRRTRSVNWENDRNPQFPQGLLLLLFFI